jgi:hypothetical protein
MGERQMDQDQQSDWMPVFATIVKNRTMEVTHPEDKAPPTRLAAKEDVVQRIGTAFREPDGSYLVSLSLLPVNGELLIRPARPGEYLRYGAGS